MHKPRIVLFLGWCWRFFFVGVVFVSFLHSNGRWLGMLPPNAFVPLIGECVWRGGQEFWDCSLLFWRNCQNCGPLYHTHLRNGRRVRITEALEEAVNANRYSSAQINITVLGWCVIIIPKKYYQLQKPSRRLQSSLLGFCWKYKICHRNLGPKILRRRQFRCKNLYVVR